MTSFGRRALEPGGQVLRNDGTADCVACELPLFPCDVRGETVLLECANRHSATAPLPRDAALRHAIESWVARRGAQLHAQHERWGTDQEEDVDETRR